MQRARNNFVQVVGEAGTLLEAQGQQPLPLPGQVHVCERVQRGRLFLPEIQQILPCLFLILFWFIYSILVFRTKRLFYTWYIN